MSLSPVNLKQLKEFKYLLNHSNYSKAYFIAKSDFNKNCLAEKNGIELINNRQLLKMIDKKILMELKENYGR